MSQTQKQIEQELLYKQQLQLLGFNKNPSPNKPLVPTTSPQKTVITMATSNTPKL